MNGTTWLVKTFVAISLASSAGAGPRWQHGGAEAPDRGTANARSGVYRPRVEPASDEGELALARFEVKEGFDVRLFAAEPHLANPVCFAVDSLGRLLVAETFRHHAGVTDMRSHMGWLHEDLASQTVEDRLTMMRRHEGERFAEYAREHERVRRIEDVDGDGLADRSTVFADGFKHPAAGIGAGLLQVGGDVLFTCIPDLWRLTDADDDGVAEARESLHTGYGVNISLLGHDLHGLCRGPDGRIYFSVGDRGFHVEHEGRVLAHPHTGAVLRCETDGSGLEIFATGLRNPQELAFDDHGDLFTGDNNSDGGDKARIVWVLPGSDSGWRYAYQYIRQPNLRGPWNAEKLWYPYFEGQAAYILPPIANLSSGPSGLCIYPGSGWSSEWDDTFFLCDFRGDPSISGVHAFRLERKGAGFALKESEQFLWGSLVTDVDFDWQGNLVVSDWVSGWNKTGKGRIYRVSPKARPVGSTPGDAAAQSSAELMAAGFADRSNAELGQLLEHGDRRIRLEAQWALAERGMPAAEQLLEAARGEGAERLHGVWGLGHLLRTQLGQDPDGYPLTQLQALARDEDPEVRSQAIRTLGDLGSRRSAGLALEALADGEARVRLFAVEAIGNMCWAEATRRLMGVLEREVSDPWMRSTVIVALDRAARREDLLSYASHPDAAVRQALCAVLRRWRDPALANFLTDESPLVAEEAARAIYDEEISELWPALAGWVEAAAQGHVRPDLSPTTWRRSLHAARTLGGERRAQAVALAALQSELPKEIREDMLRVLAEWDRALPLDPLVGTWRPQGERAAAMRTRLANALAPSVKQDGSKALLRGWVELAAAAPDAELLEGLAGVATDAKADARARRRALSALPADWARGKDVVRQLLGDDHDGVRKDAFEALGRWDPTESLSILEEALDSDSRPAIQGALSALAQLPASGADELLLQQLERLQQGQIDAGVALDLVEAAGRREALAARASAWDSRDRWDELCLEGGDPARGRRIFREKSETSCLRCHQVGEQGGEAHGGEAGPDLSKVGSRLEPGALLRSILNPNAEIAEGYETWIFGFEDDAPMAGRILEETEEMVVLVTREGEEWELDPEAIESRQRDLSGMPQNVSESLSRRDLRDLVAYLSSLR